MTKRLQILPLICLSLILSGALPLIAQNSTENIDLAALQRRTTPQQ